MWIRSVKSFYKKESGEYNFSFVKVIILLTLIEVIKITSKLKQK